MASSPTSIPTSIAQRITTGNTRATIVGDSISNRNNQGSSLTEPSSNIMGICQAWTPTVFGGFYPPLNGGGYWQNCAIQFGTGGDGSPISGNPGTAVKGNANVAPSNFLTFDFPADDPTTDFYARQILDAAEANVGTGGRGFAAGNWWLDVEVIARLAYYCDTPPTTFGWQGLKFVTQQAITTVTPTANTIGGATVSCGTTTGTGANDDIRAALKPTSADETGTDVTVLAQGFERADGQGFIIDSLFGAGDTVDDWLDPTDPNVGNGPNITDANLAAYLSATGDPDLFIIMLGTNSGINPQTQAATWIARMEDVIDRFDTQSGGTPDFLLVSPYAAASVAQAWVEAVADNMATVASSGTGGVSASRIGFVNGFIDGADSTVWTTGTGATDYSTDGTHPNQQGMIAFWSGIWTAIEQQALGGGGNPLLVPGPVITQHFRPRRQEFKRAVPLAAGELVAGTLATRALLNTALTQAGQRRVLMYGDSTSTAWASGEQYIPWFVWRLTKKAGKLVGGSSFRCSVTAETYKDSRDILTYWRAASASVTNVEGGSPSNMDVPLGGKLVTLPNSSHIALAFVLPNYDFPQGTVIGADSFEEGPDHLRGERLLAVSTLNGETVRLKLYCRSNTANSDQFKFRLRDLDNGNTFDLGTSTEAALTATTGDCVVVEDTRAIASAVYDDGFMYWTQNMDGALPLDAYGTEWSIEGQDGLVFNSWSRGSQVVRDIENESGDSDQVLGAFAPDVVLIRFGPNEGTGTYAAALGDAMDWIHAAVPGAIVVPMTAPFTPFSQVYDPSDNKIAEMASHWATIKAAVAARSGWSVGINSRLVNEARGINEAAAYAGGLDDRFVNTVGGYDGVHYKSGRGAQIIGVGDAEALIAACSVAEERELIAALSL